MKNLLKKWTAASRRTKAGIIVFAIVVVGGVGTLAGGVNAGWLRPHSLDYEINEEEDYYYEEDNSLATGEFTQGWQTGSAEENAAAQAALLENGKPEIYDAQINPTDINLARTILFAGQEWYVIGKTDAAGQIVGNSVLAAPDANSLALLAKGNSYAPEDIATVVFTPDEAGLVIPRPIPETDELQVAWTPSADEQALISPALLANAGEPVVIWLSVEDVLYTISDLKDGSSKTSYAESLGTYITNTPNPLKLTYKKDSLALDAVAATIDENNSYYFWVDSLAYSGATQGRYLAAVMLRQNKPYQYWTLSDNTSESETLQGWTQGVFYTDGYADDAQIVIVVEERNEGSIDFASPPITLTIQP